MAGGLRKSPKTGHRGCRRSYRLCVDAHRLTVRALRPGLNSPWIGQCCCGVAFKASGHRLDVEAAHQVHLLRVAEELDRADNARPGLAEPTSGAGES